MVDAQDTSIQDSGVIVPYDLGLARYLPVQDAQDRLRHAVIDGYITGALLLLEHYPVVTLGAHAPSTDVLRPAEASARGVSVVRSERGGQTTLHAPGQLISYPVMQIPRRDLRAYVNGLEEVILRVLQTVSLDADRITGRPGLYTRGMKIASVGLRCEHGVTSHGTALNVDLDLSYFDLITSCGESGLRQTSVAQTTGQRIPLQMVKLTYLRAFEEVFGLSLAPLRIASPEELPTLPAKRIG